MARYPNSKGPALVGEVEKNLIDGVRDFMAQVAIAQNDGSNEVEASQHIIDHFLKGGLNGQPYFWYQGVKVFLEGKKADVEKTESKTLEELTFPKTPA